MTIENDNVTSATVMEVDGQVIIYLDRLVDLGFYNKLSGLHRYRLQPADHSTRHPANYSKNATAA